MTDDGLRLTKAAEVTFTETLAQLLAGVLDGPSGLTVVQALSRLRSALEHERIGLPTG
ncbi:hypothetical protein [Streptomyces sp. NPDC048361]|uniref:hypothetical protein n=1 Tax=Streptomyces sp. NPDC048361 TaxID=3154720 RepID=UPI003446F295